jgi:2-isopropylmalate synthase
MRGETVGWDGSTLVLGKHSGRHALRCRLEALGHRCDDAALDLVFTRFKEVADGKKVVDDADLTALLSGFGTETPSITPVAVRARLPQQTPRTVSAL